jgi:hypothetical protein
MSKETVTPEELEQNRYNRTRDFVKDRFIQKMSHSKPYIGKHGLFPEQIFWLDQGCCTIDLIIKKSDTPYETYVALHFSLEINMWNFIFSELKLGTKQARDIFVNILKEIFESNSIKSKDLSDQQQKYIAEGFKNGTVTVDVRDWVSEAQLKRLIDGRNLHPSLTAVTLEEVIHAHHAVHVSFIDRLRVLFGAKILIHHEMEISTVFIHETNTFSPVKINREKSTTTVTKLFKRKQKYGFYCDADSPKNPPVEEIEIL